MVKIDLLSGSVQTIYKLDNKAYLVGVADLRLPSVPLSSL